MIRNLRVLDNFAEPDDFSNRLLNRADFPLVTFNPILYFQRRELLQMINDVVHVGGPPGHALRFPISPVNGFSFVRTIYPAVISNRGLHTLYNSRQTP
jgi:hypothetical protein